MTSRFFKEKLVNAILFKNGNPNLNPYYVLLPQKILECLDTNIIVE